MHLLYNIGICFYLFGVQVASFFNPKAKLWIEGRKGLLQTIKETVTGDEIIWFHCASLGEFEQGKPLMEMIKIEFPTKKILVTFFSPSGYEVRKNYKGADYVFYLPADTPANATAFVEIVNPEKAFFVKYDFWFNYFEALHKKQIPLYIVSAAFRKEQHFFSWYGKWFQKMLKISTHIFTQNQQSSDLLSSIGLNNHSVAGDTRYDTVLDNAKKCVPIPVIEKFKGKNKLIVAGSSWQAEEKISAEYWQNPLENTKCIIAPHDISESHLQQIEQLLPVLSVRFSKYESQDVPVLIIDNIGMLSNLYQYADVAFIGGGFSNSLHNILEPASFGCPVLFGNNHPKYPEAMELIAAGGGFEVSNEKNFSEAIAQLLNGKEEHQKAKEKAIRFVSSKTGATKNIFDYCK